MPTYKLTYFNARGRAETTRMLFKVAGVEFEDIRLDSDQWKAYKPSAPMEQMPVLEISDGNESLVLGQSVAITRFVANRLGLAGKTDLDKAKADMFVDTVSDIQQGLMKAFFAKEDEKEKLIAEFGKEKLPAQLKNLEKLSPDNGYLVGGALTYADIFFYNATTWFDQFKIDWGKTYPKLHKVRENVSSNPKIAAWIKERPETKM